MILTSDSNTALRGHITTLVRQHQLVAAAVSWENVIDHQAADTIMSVSDLNTETTKHGIAFNICNFHYQQHNIETY